MENKVTIDIGKKDVYWTYLSTFLQLGSGIILFPLILRLLSSETVGVWAIFTTIFSLISLLDFGFSPSFTRNISYIFSGVDSLKKTGISEERTHSGVNFELLANTIKAMKWLYSRIALIALLLLSTAGTYYLYVILKSRFTGDNQYIIIAWVLFCLISTYNIYTLYYDSLLTGRGMVKRSKQIIVISQIFYLAVSVLLLLLGFDLISIVFAQFVATLIKRILSYNSFFTTSLKKRLSEFSATSFREIIDIILPNSIKLGVTSLGGFLVLQASVIIGSFYVSLENLASYGITIQAINVIGGLGFVFYSSYVPKLSYLRVENDNRGIKNLYKKSVLILFFTFLVSGIALIYLGNPILTLLKSQTFLLSNSMISAILLISFLEKNHAMAGGFLLSKNEVPFYKASLFAGLLTAGLLFLFLAKFNLSIWALIISPGIAHLYNNFKWPYELIKQVRLS